LKRHVKHYFFINDIIYIFMTYRHYTLTKCVRYDSFGYCVFYTEWSFATSRPKRCGWTSQVDCNISGQISVKKHVYLLKILRTSIAHKSSAPLCYWVDCKCTVLSQKQSYSCFGTVLVITRTLCVTENIRVLTQLFSFEILCYPKQPWKQRFPMATIFKVRRTSEHWMETDWVNCLESSTTNETSFLRQSTICTISNYPAVRQQIYRWDYNRQRQSVVSLRHTTIW
jgi:hypothetical protein